jgi:hypothetical protein
MLADELLTNMALLESGGLKVMTWIAIPGLYTGY